MLFDLDRTLSFLFLIVRNKKVDIFRYLFFTSDYLKFWLSKIIT